MRFASRRDFYVYHMQRRGGVKKHNPILSYGRGSQKFLCRQAWMVSRNEEDHQKRAQSRPNYVRTLRKELRDYYRRQLQRAHADLSTDETLQIGRIYQIPKSGRQGRKNLHLNISRAMAIRKAVDPKCGLFITFTFNCKCPEMLDCIGSGQPGDYPDVCCRMARMKFRTLLDHVCGKSKKAPGIFGAVKGWLWSLEYQKRGNKHWHLVLMMDRNWGPEDPNTPVNIDEYITAELPPMPEQSRIYLSYKDF